MKPLLLFAFSLMFGTPQLWSQTTDTFTITVNGVNLSEDMSTLSSRNDELLLLIYDYSDTSSLSTPILSHFAVLDSIQRTVTVPFSAPADNNPVLLFLIEQDTERKPEVLEPIIRQNATTIISLFRKRDRITLQKLIGDDDVMGYRILPNLSDITFSINGRYKLDKYSYVITIRQ